MNDTATKPRKSAQKPLPNLGEGAAFLRGRDLAIAMACTGVAAVASNPDADEAADTVVVHYKHALSVLELVAHEMNQSGVVFAARNLMRADLPRLMAAFDEGVDALNEASADLWVVLELLAAAAHTVSDVNSEEESCVWGAHALATLSKTALDEHIRKVERSGAAS